MYFYQQRPRLFSFFTCLICTSKILLGSCQIQNYSLGIEHNHYICFDMRYTGIWFSSIVTERLKLWKHAEFTFGYHTKKIGSKTSKEVGSFDFHGLITVKSGNGSSCSGYNICPLQQKLGLYFHKIVQLHYHQYSWKVHERLTAAWICVFILV